MFTITGPLTRYEGHESHVEIPSGVTRIESGVFRNCESLKSLTIPGSVTAIGSQAFEGCIRLKNVIIPNSVMSIGDNTFKDCSRLESVVISDNVKYIPLYAFYECKSLKSLTIPDGVTGTGPLAFMDCSSLKSVIIPNSMKYINEDVFAFCTSLKSVVIPDSVKYIGEGAFRYCESLERIIIPNSVVKIDDRAFKECTSLKSVTIPGSVTSIGDGAFERCSSLKKIIIPDSVTSIGNYAFERCSSLKKIIIPDSVTSIGYYAFRECSSLESVIIPDSVTSIGPAAFYRCTSLKSVVIPNSVTNIGDGAFDRCPNLDFIIVGDELEKLRVSDLVPGNLKGKLITQQAYDNYIKEKNAIILRVLVECLLSVNRQGVTCFPLNIFISTILPWLQYNHIDSGKIELLRLIFSFLSCDEFKKHLPELVGLLGCIKLSYVPRSYSVTSLESYNYSQSKERYEANLKRLVNEYARSYESFCNRPLQVSGLFSLSHIMSTWGSDHRHDSANAQRAFDKRYGIILYESGKSFLLRVGESIINSRISRAVNSHRGDQSDCKRKRVGDPIGDPIRGDRKKLKSDHDQCEIVGGKRKSKFGDREGHNNLGERSKCPRFS